MPFCTKNEANLSHLPILKEKQILARVRNLTLIRRKLRFNLVVEIFRIQKGHLWKFGHVQIQLASKC